MIDWGFVDMPNVVAEASGKIQICGSSWWKRLRNIPEVFVSIISHESLHQTLSRVDGESSEELDNIGSLSSISRSLRDISKCRQYPHGLIGIDGFHEESKIKGRGLTFT